VREWGKALAEEGFAVEVPRLPGHGTTWREMNTTTWEEWYGEITRVFDKLAAENDVVVACGLSMGGALVLRLAEDHPDDLAGVVVVNPAVSTKRLDVRFLPVLKHIVPAFPGIGSDIKKAGVVEEAYAQTPLKAAHSMMQAWPGIVGDLGKITAPLLYFRSTIDNVVDESSEPLIVGGVSGEVTMVRLTDSYHVATVDNDAPEIFARSAAFIAEVAGVRSRA
jgi:carboxylesterase